MKYKYVHHVSTRSIPWGVKFPACSVLINEEDVAPSAAAPAAPPAIGDVTIVEHVFLLPPLSRNSIVIGVPPAPSIRSSVVAAADAGLGPASYKTIPITMQRKAKQKYGVNRKPIVRMSKNAANKSLVSRRIFSSALVGVATM